MSQNKNILLCLNYTEDRKVIRMRKNRVQQMCEYQIIK